jgi:hypothetical protein
MRIHDPVDVLLLVVFVLLAVGLVLQLRQAWLTRLMNQRAQHRRPRDVSAEMRPADGDAFRLMAELDRLGFHRLGETEMVIPELGLTAMSWVRVDAEGTTTAEVVDMPPEGLLAFVSVFGDGAQIETGYPVGEQIRDPDYRTRQVSSSSAEAYALHRQEIDDFGQAHGRPLAVADMAGFIRHEVAGRQRFSQRKLGRAWRRIQLGSVLRLVIALAVVGGLLLVSAR